MNLRLTATHERPASVDADAVLLGVFEDQSLPAATAEVDVASGGALRRLLETGDLPGKSGHLTRLFHLSGVKAPRVVLLGLGEPRKFDSARYHRACIEAAKAVSSGPVRRAASFLPEIELKGRDAGWRTRQAAVAADSAVYRYTATVKAKNGNGLEELILPAAAPDVAWAEARGIAAGVALARDLGNLPPNLCTPAYLADQARRIAAEEPAVRVEVLEREQMQGLGMGALLAVAQGSAQSPRLIILRYQGAEPAAKPYVLVGKGITFDTGGVNLKVQGGIEEMKYDMCGAAAVLGAFLAAARMKLALNVVAVVPAVENMPDGNSYRPSDVLRSMSGLTIEVGNTDAEGRLILCDALTYARRFEPVAMVDVATLTGACVIALGKHAHGLMTPADELADELLLAGETAIDRAWRLPLWDDYQKQLESAFADVYNVGGKGAGAITAGCFLARFTEGQRWAHLDIAGTAWDEGRKGMATGRPVAMLAQWLIDRVG